MPLSPNMSDLVIVNDRLTETSYALHTECLATLRDMLGDDRNRLVEISPAALGTSCNLTNCSR